jgi:hypothetical protein
MARPKTITIEVTDRGAVYVNNCRITGRETKWGIHTTVFSAKVKSNEVVGLLKEHGYGHIRLDKDYASEFGIEV